MIYCFDYGFAENGKWLDGAHIQESYENDKQAFARYIQIQTNGKRAEKDMKAANMLTEGCRFVCTVELFQNGEPNYKATIAFYKETHEIWKERQC